MTPKERLIGWAQEDSAMMFKIKLAEQIDNQRRLFEANFTPANDREFSPLWLGLAQGRIQGMKSMLELLENLAQEK